MDLEAMQIPLIFVAFFIIASVILSIVYKFGMKEKSYEEALAEQRQSTQNLLGIKLKPKEKKTKKTSKKKDIEEKKTIPENKTEVRSILKQEKQPEQQQKPKQIKFDKIIQGDEVDAVIKPIQSAVEIIEPKPHKEKIQKKKDELPKKEILKTEKIVTKKETPASENQKIKKPEVQLEKKKEINELTESVKLEEKPKAPMVPNKIKKEIEEKPVSNKTKREIEEKTVVVPNKTKKEIEEKPVVVSITNGFVQNQLKQQKKKKNELNSLHMLAPGSASVDVLLEIIHKAELSHGEIQVLIDLLLNKHQTDRGVISGDWSEGRSDPVQKLKKQLAEKEKDLADMQEMLAGVQLKCKEIRTEQHTERLALNQKVKLLEEQLQNQQLEILSFNNRQLAQNQQLQQSQVQFNEERMKNNALRDELGALKMQRQQYEMHMAQEATQLRAELQEFSTRNEQLIIEINHIQKVSSDNEASLVAQLNNMSQELIEKTRQLEELDMKLNNKNDILYRQEGDFKTEIAQLNAVMQQQAEEIRKTEQGKAELIDELNNLKKQKNISNNVIAKLKSDIEQLQQEKIQNEASMENNKVNETEILNLKNEMTSMRNKFEEKEKKFQLELEAKLNQLKLMESEFDEQKTKNNDLRNKNYKLVEALNAAESRMQNGNEKHSDDKNSQVEAQKKFLSRLLPEIGGLNEISPDKWEDECLNLVNNYLHNLKKNEDSNNLQAKVEHYKNVIEDTEGMLKKLQAQIDAEEISWKAQIKSKDSELEALKEKIERSKNLESINGSKVEGQ